MRRRILATLLVCLATAPAAAQPLAFRQPTGFPVGSSPFDLVVDRIDGDDHLDLLTANFADGTVSVLLGTGTGDFVSLEDTPASTAPLKAVLARLDADEHADLLVTEGESDFMYLRRGNGDGTFAAEEEVPSGHDPYAIAIADMNEDGKVDVVQTLAAETGGRVNVLLGDGEGTFDFDEERGRRVNGPSYGVAIGDFDEDGHLDAAATTLGRPQNCDLANCGSLAVMLGDGQGNLARAVEYPTGGAPFPLLAVDLDEDGHLDILTADSTDNRVSFFKGDGDGGFQRTTRYPTGVTPASLALVDFESDGWLDLVVANTRSGDISVLPGLAGGALGPARHFVAGQTLYSAAAADFDEDGRLDLVGVSQGDLEPAAALLRARAEGGVEAAQTLLPEDEATAIAAGDVRGDGLPVIALSISGQSRVALFEPRGTQDFAPPVSLTTPFRPGPLALRDLNGDGRADLVAAGVMTPRLTVALANGEGGFGTPALLEVAGNPAALAVADLDDDGHLDLASSSIAARSVSVLFNQGDGTFGAAVTVALTGLPFGLAVGDLDGDGIDDLAVGNAQENAVALILGNRERSLGSGSVAVGGTPSAVACADLDGDGIDDLAVSSGTQPLVRVLFGNGAGQFGIGPQLGSGRPPAAIALRDVTGDLHPDVIATRQGDVDAVLFVNRGDRSFVQAEEFPLGLRPGAIAVADFDLDGRYDTGVSGSGSWVLTNDGEEGALRRGDGNGDGVLSVADVLALRRGGRIKRVEDLRRTGGGTTAGADGNGDGLLDHGDERLALARLFR